MSEHEHTSIKSFRENDCVNGCYIISDIHLGTTSTGKPYLSAKLKDNSGSINMKVWDYSGEINAEYNGTIVSIIGMVKSYRDANELHVECLCPAKVDDYISDLPDIVPTAPINCKKRWKYFQSMIESVNDYDYYTLLMSVFAEYANELYTIPAAKSVHHNFNHGLLMHVTDMVWIAEKIAEKYSYAVNRDLLITGVLLHDIGKIYEFDISFETGIVRDYSDSGNMLGHAILGIQVIHKIAEEKHLDSKKILLLEHIIASHHGLPEWGAAKEPIILEAMLVHIIDDLDSRVEIYRSAAQYTSVDSYTSFIPALSKKMYKDSEEYTLTRETDYSFLPDFEAIDVV